MTTKPGTYALVLECTRTARIEIGKLGQLDVQPGVYVYIGSAFGPGGLAARIRHHARVSMRPHWHIDYFRASCELTEVWWITGSARLEHVWAGAAVASLPSSGVPMPGFGASDCTCATHLFRFQRKPSPRRLTHTLTAVSGGPDRPRSCTSTMLGVGVVPVNGIIHG